jgi:hypothetical protein
MKVLYQNVFVFLLFLAIPSLAVGQWSQSVLDVKTDRFPVIDLHVAVKWNTALTRDVDSSQFRVFEDGYEQTPLTLLFEDAQQGFSIAIVVPVTSTMSAGDIATGKGIGLRLVDRMNGSTDEGAVFDGNQAPRQTLTYVKPLLTGALDGLQPGGAGVSIWDGTYAALAEMSVASNADRAVILLSNGRGGSGTKTLQDVISLANAARIKVHCYGINAVNSDQEMKDLSAQTGGTFYTNADLLVQEVIDNLSGRPQYGILTYTTSNHCRDGIARDLAVRFRQASDSITTTMPFPLTADPATNVAVTIVVDTASITSGSSEQVALKLSPPIQGQRLYPGVISLTFDTSLLRLTQAITAGTLSSGMNASVAALADGADVTLTNTATINGSGTLLLLDFSAGEVSNNTDIQVGISDIKFDRGCITTQTASGRVTIRPRSAALAVSASPVVFTWNTSSGRYAPDPAVVAIEVNNIGDLPVTGLSARLGQDKDLRRAYGAVSDVIVRPDSLAPGQRGNAVFLVNALPVRSERTAQVPVTVSGDITSRTQTLYFNIKAAESAVRSYPRVDEIRIQGGTYTPDPATLTVAVHSAGTQASPGGTVTIDVPNELTPSTGPSQGFTSMQSGDSTILVWSLQYPTDGSAATYVLGIITEPAGGLPDTSYVNFSVPELTTAQLDVACTIEPLRLLWSPAGSEYTPSMATFEVTIENTGSVDAKGIEASIQLPEGLTTLDSPTISITELSPGDNEKIQWRVTPIKRCSSDDLDILVTVAMPGIPDQTCTKSVFVQSANSAKPDVISSTPAAIDTVDRGAAVTFTVDAQDADGDELRYLWGVNDAFEPLSIDHSFSRVFDINGEYEVVCVILDPCAIAGEGDSTVLRWNFTVRSSLRASSAAHAEEIAILGNYPNPFNPGTMIEYQLPQGSRPVRIDVLDTRGRVLRTLVDDMVPGGRSRVYFDADGLPSATYTIRLQSGSIIRTHQVTLVK